VGEPKAKNTTKSELRVRFAETDLMGIVHHASYLVYFEAGRVEWLRKRGITYIAWVERGIHLPVANAELRYRATARFDDLLVVETTLSKLRTVSLDYSYRILRPSDDVVVADGMTRLACVDNDHKLLRIPEDIRGVLLGGETA
jgi:acyl-CoA thioester hydrolase